jgi:hypothetical protein
MTTALKSPFSNSSDLFIDQSITKPFKSIESYEQRMSVAYYKYIESLSLSKEGLDSAIIKSFVDKAIAFIRHVSSIILQIIFNVVAFFKKLILSAMDDFSMRKYSEYYQTHKETISENFNKYASKVFVNAIPPKSINSFNADNKITLSVDRTVNLLNEVDRTFKQRVDLWDQYNKRAGDRGTNALFDRLFNSLDALAVNFSDTMLLGKLGIRIPYDLNAITFYDAQVKNYMIQAIKSKAESDNIAEILGTAFNSPKKIINIYLFGKDEVNTEVISVADFLKYSGPREFDKLLYSDMNRIKSNSLIISGLVNKMETIAKRLEVSGKKFCDNLQSNTPFLLKAISSDKDDTKSGIDIARQLITPLLSVSSSFYSYFSSILLNYSLYYLRHRKALYNAARMLCENPNAA